MESSARPHHDRVINDDPTGALIRFRAHEDKERPPPPQPKSQRCAYLKQSGSQKSTGSTDLQSVGDARYLMSLKP